jgi:hypothetical protein
MREVAVTPGVSEFGRPHGSATALPRRTAIGHNESVETAIHMSAREQQPIRSM